ARAVHVAGHRVRAEVRPEGRSVAGDPGGCVSGLHAGGVRASLRASVRAAPVGGAEGFGADALPDAREVGSAPGAYAERSLGCLVALGPRTRVGLTLLRTTPSSITHLVMSLLEGSSYMTLRSTSSRMARSPRAPVERRMAWSAMALRASSLNSNSTPSNSTNFWYCLTSA